MNRHDFSRSCRNTSGMIQDPPHILDAVQCNDTMITILNESRIMLGLASLFVSIGLKYIHADIGHVQEYILSTPVMKAVIVFSMFFVATRDVALSSMLALAYLLLFVGLLHENSDYSVIPPTVRAKLQEKIEAKSKNSTLDAFF